MSDAHRIPGLDDKGRYTYNKGKKPYQIKQAQREVRNLYITLCEARSPQQSFQECLGDIILSLGEKKDAILAANPAYMAIATSAARAYCGAGLSLKDHKMWSMNVTLTLDQFKELGGSSAIAAQCAERGLTEITVLAREI